MALVEVTVGTVGLDPATDVPVVVLAERDCERTFPIWIGRSEAAAIWRHIAGEQLSRPLTHDLFASVVEDFGGKLDQVVIEAIVDGKYLADLYLSRGEEKVIRDARPSDAIAVALRLDSTILVEEDFLTSATVELRKPSPDTEAAAPRDEDEHVA